MVSAAARTEQSDRAGLLRGLVVVLLINAVLIGLFYNKAWIPSDDGHYAHVADRLASGEVLNADVEELHPGYVHFVHAASFAVFGRDLVALRYPLMALMAAQSVLTYWLFRRPGPGRGGSSQLAAVAAAVTMSAIGALQIANPTTSLYALACTLVLAAVVLHTSPDTRRRGILVGVVVGLVFLFRQLTAVFVVMGVLAFLFNERPQPARRLTDVAVGRAILGLSAVGLVGYCVLSASVGTIVLFGVGACAVIAWAGCHATLSNGQVVRLVAQMGLGALLAAVPLIIYHLANGSLGDWLRDTFVRSLSVTGLEHIEVGRYMQDLFVPAVRNLVTGSLWARVNALYWGALVLIGFAVAVRLCVHLRRRVAFDGAYVVPILAVLYAMVSVFNQIPYYLYLSAGLSLVAWLWMSAVIGTGPSAGRTAAVVALALSTIAVVSHAGQPYTRTYADLVRGDRVEVAASSIDRMGLWIDPTEDARYAQVVDIIQEATGESDAIFTVPNSAELYFLSERQNPFRLFNPTISLLSDAELDEFADEFARVKPAMIIHDTASSYNTADTARLLDEISAGYVHLATVDNYEIYSLDLA